MNRVVGVLLSTLSLLVACDIPGRLVIKNKSGAEARVRFYPHKPEAFPFTLDLLAAGQGSTREVIYGFGQWFVGRQLEEHIVRFRQVDIITQRDSISITDTAQFRTWYTEGRRGRGFICVWKVK